VLIFAVIPLGFSVLSITVSMLVVYVTVRTNARKSRKWSFGVGKNSLESKVFWQALLYTLSFYITWPILFSVYIASTDYTRGYDVGRYTLPVLVSFVAPLQGFTNFLVYARPRLMRTAMFRRVFTRLASVIEHQTTASLAFRVDDSTLAQHFHYNNCAVDPSAAIATQLHRAKPFRRNPSRRISPQR